MINLKRIIRTSTLRNGLSISNRFFISAFWLVGIGVLIGAVAVGTFYHNDNSFIHDICLGYFEKRATQSIFSCFAGTFLSTLITLLILYLLGLCAVGAPLIYCALVFDSIGKGLIFGFVYLEYGFWSILKALIFLVPQNVCLCILIILASRFSLKMSRQIGGILSDDRAAYEHQFSKKTYNNRYLIFVLGLFVVSIFDALMSKFTALIIK